MPKSERFWRERTGWPAVHYLCATGLIASDVLPLWGATLTLLVAYLLLYLFESAEGVLGLLARRWRESKSDSVIGDILIGATAVTSFWLLDELAQFDDATRRLVPYWLRVAAMLTFIAAAPFFERLNRRGSDSSDDDVAYGWRVGTLAYGAFYSAVVMALYVVVPLCRHTHHEHRRLDAAAHGAVWAIIAVGAAAIGARIVPQWSTFQLVMAYAATLLFLLVTATLATR